MATVSHTSSGVPATSASRRIARVSRASWPVIGAPPQSWGTALGVREVPSGRRERDAVGQVVGELDRRVELGQLREERRRDELEVDRVDRGAVRRAPHQAIPPPRQQRGGRGPRPGSCRGARRRRRPASRGGRTRGRYGAWRRAHRRARRPTRCPKGHRRARPPRHPRRRPRAASLPDEGLVLQAVRLLRLGPELLLAVLDVLLVRPLEPAHLRVALERQHVRGDAVEEPAIVRDHDRAAGEVEQRVFEGAQRVDVEVVGRLVEQQQVRPALQQLGQVQAVALAAGEVADALLLVGAAEVEAGDVGARVDVALADDQPVLAAGDGLPDRLLGLEVGAHLVDVGHLDGVADAQRAAVGLLLAGDHAEQRRLARAVGADHPDDAAGRQLER